MPAYEYKHVVAFEETSLIGNVYFSNYLIWQGHCRERFLHDHAKEIVGRLLGKELAFFTRSCSCEFMGDWGFTALDEVAIHMWLRKFRGGRMTLEFEYLAASGNGTPVARGFQEVACKASTSGGWVPAPFPASLVVALKKFADTPELQAALDDALEFQRDAGQ